MTDIKYITINTSFEGIDRNWNFNIHFFQNVQQLQRNVKTIFCFHGNSSSYLTFEKFARCMSNMNIQVIAPDLPGCGKSDRLPNYSMEIVGSIMSDFIRSFDFDTNCINLFGHSLGGHLLAYIHVSYQNCIIAGTPPLSSNDDFPFAFNPSDIETQKLMPLLSKSDAFTLDEATCFVTHTGIDGTLLMEMITDAVRTDGKFRFGCLTTLTKNDQLKQLNCRNNNSVVVIHASEDGVVSYEWLNSKINKNVLFEGKIHSVKGKHMSPYLCAEEISSLLNRVLNNSIQS